LAGARFHVHDCDDQQHHAFSVGTFVGALHAGAMTMLNASLTSHVGRWSRLCLVVLASCILMACQTMQPPAVDQVRFTPWPAAKRVIDQPKLKYLARQDGYEYCARITGIPVTPSSRVMACAFWNVRRKECTVVTPLETGYNYLGHELRHCFDGAFHD
jgi:hypothetical protein